MSDDEKRGFSELDNRLWDKFTDVDNSGVKELDYLHHLMLNPPPEVEAELEAGASFLARGSVSTSPSTILGGGGDVWQPLLPPAPVELLPSEFEPYDIIGWLGEGGMDVVHLARHRGSRKEYALKTPRELTLEAKQRFERAAGLNLKVRHQHVVETVEFSKTEEGRPYLVMERLAGMDMKQVLVNAYPIPVADACEIARQAALGLRAIHEEGTIHRDVKPSNLFLDWDGITKVLDFGLARREHQSTDQATGITQSFQAMGTPDYIAPEQSHDAKRVLTPSDIYSLGVTLFELITGLPPFADMESVQRKLGAHAIEVPPLLSDAREDVPRGLVRLVDSMLAKKPENRPRTAQEVIDALAVFARGSDLVRLLSRASDRPLEDQGQLIPKLSPRPRAMVATSEADVGAGFGSKASTSVLPEKGSSAKWREKRQRRQRQRQRFGFSLAAVVGLSLVLAGGYLALASFGGGGMPEPGAAVRLKVEQFSIEYLMASEDQANEAGKQRHVQKGRLGSEVFQVKAGDKVQLAAELSKSAYSYIIAFQPDGKIVPCWPLEPGKTPELSNQPRYPELGNFSKAFGLTDGAGLQVFAIVASSSPLPSFERWLAQAKEPPPWKEGIMGRTSVVWSNDGSWTLAHTLEEPGGVSRSTGADSNLEEAVLKIDEIAAWLHKQPGVGVLAIKGFVVPKSAGS